MAGVMWKDLGTHNIQESFCLGLYDVVWFENCVIRLRYRALNVCLLKHPMQCSLQEYNDLRTGTKSVARASIREVLFYFHIFIFCQIEKITEFQKIFFRRNMLDKWVQTPLPIKALAMALTGRLDRVSCYVRIYLCVYIFVYLSVYNVVTTRRQRRRQNVSNFKGI
jgi:hypothetical protein